MAENDSAGAGASQHEAVEVVEGVDDKAVATSVHAAVEDVDAWPDVGACFASGASASGVADEEGVAAGPWHAACAGSPAPACTASFSGEDGEEAAKAASSSASARPSDQQQVMA